MNYLVDTNVLLPFGRRGNPFRAVVRTAIRRLRCARGHVASRAQNFVEFWNVSTRPLARNGFGLAPTAADRRLRRIEQLFPILPASPTVYTEWRRLVVAYGVSGVQVHDAHLVAVMRIHGVGHILTFNTADFVRYAPEGLTAIDPATM